MAISRPNVATLGDYTAISFWPVYLDFQTAPGHSPYDRYDRTSCDPFVAEALSQRRYHRLIGAIERTLKVEQPQPIRVSLTTLAN